MNHMPVLFVYDAPCDEIYCATNVSESDALKIAMSAIEENVEKRFHCRKFDTRLYKDALEDMIIYYNYTPVL